MKKKDLAKVFSVIYCIEGELNYNDIFSGKYEDLFLLHTGLYTGEVLRELTNKNKEAIKKFINETNFILS